ncbi:hypothetical protein LJR013_002628 [Pseudarthrobacter oxydans]|uniref:hypothetical protein n=1 Tax=Pseudarthrobacter oxydans TaxID=1671 RepID=UPI003ECCFCAE
MDEKRRGEEWQIDDRVVYIHRNPERQDRVLGKIVDKSWGRDGRSLPIWRFLVVAEGETERWPADPEHLQGATDELIAEISQAAVVHSLVDEIEPAPDMVADPNVFPESPPDPTEFGPVYASEMREYRKRKRRWERDQEQADSQEKP